MISETSYDGGAFHDSLPRGKASGQITVSSAAVLFRTGDNEFQVPLDGVVIKRGGASDRLLFFTNPRVEGLSVFTSDSEILKNPRFQSRMELRNQLGGLTVKKWRGRAIVSTILIVILAIFPALYLAKEPLVSAVADNVPVAWEEKLGDSAYKQLIVGKRVIEGPEVDAQIRKLTDPLLAALGPTDYQFKFHVIEDSQVNAFAVPGGNVVINHGLLLKAESPEEVAGVLAHEISHVTLKHSIRQIISAAGLYIVLQAMIGNFNELLAVLADNSAFFLTRKFSRDYEQEADEQGWKYLINGNIDPIGMIQFFKKLKSIEDETFESLPGEVLKESMKFFSTHPGTEERIGYLEEKYKELPANLDFVRLEVDLKTVQDAIRIFIDPEASIPTESEAVIDENRD